MECAPIRTISPSGKGLGIGHQQSPTHFIIFYGQDQMRALFSRKSRTRLSTPTMHTQLRFMTPNRQFMTKWSEKRTAFTFLRYGLHCALTGFGPCILGQHEATSPHPGRTIPRDVGPPKTPTDVCSVKKHPYPGNFFRPKPRFYPDT